MDDLTIKIKKTHPDAKIPRYMTDGSAGMDLYAVSREFDDYGNIVYGIGLAFEIPKGYAGKIYPRSSISRYDIDLTNCVGVIDSDYRGEVSVKYKPALVYWNDCGGVGINNDIRVYEIGDRVAQIIIEPCPRVTFVETDRLSETERGAGGYGSTGVS